MKQMEIEKEEWRRCFDPYERYEVSNMGIVRNGLTKKIISQNKSLHYMKVVLRYKCAPHSVWVHRLVAFAFCEGYKEGMQVNHINGDKCDNRASNLEWVTTSENAIHASLNIKKNNKPIVVFDKKGHPVHIFPSLGRAERYFQASLSRYLKHGFLHKGLRLQRISREVYNEVVSLMDKQQYTLRSAWIEANTNLFIDKNV